MQQENAEHSALCLASAHTQIDYRLLHTNLVLGNPNGSQPELGMDGTALNGFRVIVKSGVQRNELGGGLVDLCHLDPIFEFDPGHQLRQVIETA